MVQEEFYNREFRYSNSTITRGELESLPCAFCTKDVSDEDMQAIIRETHLETCSRLRLPENEPIDFENDRVSEVWWEELENACNRFDVPYYEDLPCED